MRWLAEFEIKSGLTHNSAEKKLSFKHPLKGYEFQLKQRPRKDGVARDVLVAWLFFDAEDIQNAKNISLDLLIEALDFFALVTATRFEFSRLLKIVEWTSRAGMRQALVAAQAGDNPAPLLTQRFFDSAELLASHPVNKDLERALRWFRLALVGETPDEQFQCFWFSLEILAEHFKPIDRVNDACPQCGGKLYCESCNSYPTHKPYNKQAIHSLLKSFFQSEADSIFKALNEVRNGLMHGERISSIDVAEYFEPYAEDEEPALAEDLIDILAIVVRTALMKIFPSEIVEKLFTGNRQNFLRMRVGALAHIETVMQFDEDGDPKLDHFPKVDLAYDEDETSKTKK